MAATPRRAYLGDARGTPPTPDPMTDPLREELQRSLGTAYSIAYMKALLQRANEEVGT